MWPATPTSAVPESEKPSLETETVTVDKVRPGATSIGPRVTLPSKRNGAPLPPETETWRPASDCPSTVSPGVVSLPVNAPFAATSNESATTGLSTGPARNAVCSVVTPASVVNPKETDVGGALGNARTDAPQASKP